MEAKGALDGVLQNRSGLGILQEEFFGFGNVLNVQRLGLGRFCLGLVTAPASATAGSLLNEEHEAREIESGLFEFFRREPAEHDHRQDGAMGGYRGDESAPTGVRIEMVQRESGEGADLRLRRRQEGPHRSQKSPDD